jgi:hypothetical protein
MGGQVVAGGNACYRRFSSAPSLPMAEDTSIAIARICRQIRPFMLKIRFGKIKYALIAILHN